MQTCWLLPGCAVGSLSSSGKNCFGAEGEKLFLKVVFDPSGARGTTAWEVWGAPRGRCGAGGALGVCKAE